MTEAPEISSGPGKRRSLARRLWKSTGRSMLSQAWLGALVATLVYWCLRFINRTNPFVAASDDLDEVYRRNAPAIVAFWHGQHFMAPFLAPRGERVAALVSRSADAELNARIIEKFGHETVRGSGGREKDRFVEKGGARALVELKRKLEKGMSVVMIADISKAEARMAGKGVILLAKLSGRPIVATAYASSRRKIIARSWDKTTIHLPFGQAAAITGEPMFVPRDADDGQMELLRKELTLRLNSATERAYALVDNRNE